MLGLAAVPRAGFVSPTTTTTLQAASKLPVKDWTTPLPLVIGPTEVTPSEIVKVASANAKSATATDAKAITTSFKLLMGATHVIGGITPNCPKPAVRSD